MRLDMHERFVDKDDAHLLNSKTKPQLPPNQISIELIPIVMPSRGALRAELADMRLVILSAMSAVACGSSSNTGAQTQR